MTVAFGISFPSRLRAAGDSHPLPSVHPLDSASLTESGAVVKVEGKTIPRSGGNPVCGWAAGERDYPSSQAADAPHRRYARGGFHRFHLSPPFQAPRHFLHRRHGTGAQAIETLVTTHTPPRRTAGAWRAFLQALEAPARHDALAYDDDIGGTADDLFEGKLGIGAPPSAAALRMPRMLKASWMSVPGPATTIGSGWMMKSADSAARGRLCRPFFSGPPSPSRAARRAAPLPSQPQGSAHLPDAPRQLPQASCLEDIAGDAKALQAAVNRPGLPSSVRTTTSGRAATTASSDGFVKPPTAAWTSRRTGSRRSRSRRRAGPRCPARR